MIPATEGGSKLAPSGAPANRPTLARGPNNHGLFCLVTSSWHTSAGAAPEVAFLPTNSFANKRDRASAPFLRFRRRMARPYVRLILLTTALPPPCRFPCTHNVRAYRLSPRRQHVLIEAPPPTDRTSRQIPPANPGAAFTSSMTALDYPHEVFSSSA